MAAFVAAGRHELILFSQASIRDKFEGFFKEKTLIQFAYLCNLKLQLNSFLAATLYSWRSYLDDQQIAGANTKILISRCTPVVPLRASISA